MSKNLSTSVKKNTFLFLTLFFLMAGSKASAQIYYHNFGTTAITAHPYTVAPTTLNTRLSGSSWSNSLNTWTSTTGATGEAIRLTTATAATITLTFNVAANFQAEITSFDFWRVRSNFGPQNWSMTINGINAGNGTIGTTGAALGTTNVANTISGLTGTVTVVISLSGATGNGTFRLDDFTLNGSVTSNCAAPTITSFSPTSGPQNTIVTINGNGFLAGTGTSAVKFNGIDATSFTVVSNTVIKAYVPAGNATGNISITTNGCEGFSSTGFTKLETSSIGNYSSDIYISELHDAQAGDGGVIEIYNGTASTVNLTGYTIRRYGDIGGATFYTIVLSGSIPPGGIFLIGIGTGVIPCSITSNQTYPTGFNANDEFELIKNGVVIDNVHAPNNVGYSVIRNPNAVAPKVVFNGSDWNTQTSESCANIGIHNVSNPTPPTLTNPTSRIICENNSVTYTATLANSTGFTFQWKRLDASGNWVNITNGAPYSGATTNTLTINPTPLTFDDNQYYCQVTSTQHTLISHAAQLEVNPSTVPDFATALSFCNGETVPALSTTSPNGVTGTWSPATISNTASGSYVFTPTAGLCSPSVTLNVTISNSIVPDFATTLTFCNGETVPALQATSPNGITGTWSPATISNTANGSYVFTPNAGQCATPMTLNVTINNNILPDFPTTLALCNGGTVPTLNTTSPNGITGTWAPAAINNTASGSYVFTPNAGQCATNMTLNVTVNSPIAPDFPTTLAFCNGATVPTLQATSPNGITGTWSPAAISNTASGSYVFTPNTGQCATLMTLNVTITNNITPDFPTVLAFCNGATVPTLQATSPNGITGTWSPATISNTASGSYVFTPNTGQCAIAMTLNVTINNNITPDFPTTLAFCNGATVPTLQATSPNGITGTWSPATISNTASGSYVFTPNTGQCATAMTLNVTISNNITPDFPTALAFCNGATVPTLQATSPNGITGTWSPATISNTASGSYVFTPNAGQCATAMTLNVTISNNITPDFPTTLAFCNGATVPALQATSPNGITGTWSPATISNTASGSYVFTPNTGQCATAMTLNVTINNNITPDFPTVLAFCNGGTIPALQATSPNGITGTWSPASISNTASGSYVFTPTAGQCATAITLNVTISNNITPDFPTALSFCNGATVPTLQATSPNGITGTWSPATISNVASGSYVFTPNTGQCATAMTLNVTINNNITPDFPTILAFCNGGTVPALQATSPNGITGTWSPASISNTASGSYVFTPTAGQCATAMTLNVAINNNIVPDFATAMTFCSGDGIPILNTTSPNGITGSWNPATISNTASGSYVFTPSTGQCAIAITLNVTINNQTVPDFATTMTLCNGSTAPALVATSPNGITGTWSPAVISNTASGSYVFTPNAGQCATSTTLNVTVTNSITPSFATALNLCSGAIAPVLSTTSPNGITGTWSPATISNTVSGSYVFTPNAGQCAVNATLNVTINGNTVPDFPTSLAFCNGETVPALLATSPNGITGTWNPATISNTASGNYVFTPNAGQCATSITLRVTINSRVVPNFATVMTFCNGGTVPALNTTSPNGITGTWTPATISNTANGTYVFTPNTGQCATNATLNVTINPTIVPDFATALAFCSGETVPALQATSPNGISGTWSPATISNTASGSYVFTPNAGQCATSTTLNVTINNSVALPAINGPISVCITNTIQLTHTTPGGTWSSNNTNAATVDAAGNVTGVNAGTAVITYSVGNGNCTSIVRKTIIVYLPPSPVLKDDFICLDNQTGAVLSTVTLYSHIPNANHTFVWTRNNVVLPTTTNTHIATEPGNYQVVVTNLNTGCTASASATVGTSSLAIATATVGRDFDKNQIITVNVTGGSGQYEFQLNGGTPQQSNQFTNIYEGEYEITVKDTQGCGEITLTVYALNYPYYFTPNADGYNDTWNVDGLANQPEAMIYIFDRYGKLIKQIFPSSAGWDGTYNGHALPATDYWFKLLYKSRDGVAKEFKAHFALKR
ncbi:T9SS type B sorting domain-containing protein [Flavobacterium sp. WW92]|uniref:T9SS type B sorting domain-containing protein n=1 Tax=unclassified Flavobacterium TaxID=196869 RepID=UPI00222554F6|nr:MULTISPECIES: T9SS type B sorting domain-containing protein [unclassified Flavobacterium]WDO11518.1 T9SS type B sorting domain-containing protein [Flavobacterium sp. WW92]